MNKTGWKPIPLSLKILAGVFIFWSVMAVITIGMIAESGFPFLGMLITGLSAVIIVLLLNVVAPITFLFGLWNRKSWTAKFGLSYIGFFLLNSAIAYAVLAGQFVSAPFYFPEVANVIFFVVIYKTRIYFEK
jgi:hypothetical protein